jgi:hypothetical protein
MIGPNPPLVRTNRATFKTQHDMAPVHFSSQIRDMQPCTENLRSRGPSRFWNAQLDAQLVLRKRLKISTADDQLWSIGLQSI